jgi:hypothetical protein
VRCADPTTPGSAAHSATIDVVPARVATIFVVVAAASMLAAGCGSEGGDAPKAPLAFCKAAARYDDRVSRNAKIDEQIGLVQRMVDTAPAKIKADAQSFVDALRRVETDKSVKDDPNVKRAVENVNRYAAQGCGFYERQGGGGI